MTNVFINAGNNKIKNSVSKISAVICIICASSAVAVLVLLIVNSKTAREITSFSLYSSFLIIFYIINSIYHFFPFHNKAKKVFYILSHVFFIMMIWGVYIPPCLISLKNGWGWSFFGIITGLCVLGITLRSVFVYRWRGFFSFSDMFSLIKKESHLNDSILLFIVYLIQRRDRSASAFSICSNEEPLITTLISGYRSYISLISLPESIRLSYTRKLSTVMFVAFRVTLFDNFRLPPITNVVPVSYEDWLPPFSLK